jgi:hypothetical protein
VCRTSPSMGWDGNLPSCLRPDGHRWRSLSAHNKNYTKIISITILTVMPDLWAPASSTLFLTLFLQILHPLHPGCYTLGSQYNIIGLDYVSPKVTQ